MVMDILNNRVEDIWDRITNIKEVESLIFAIDKFGIGLYHKEHESYALIEYDEDDYTKESKQIKLSFNDIIEYLTLEECKEKLIVLSY